MCCCSLLNRFNTVYSSFYLVTYSNTNYFLNGYSFVAFPTVIYTQKYAHPQTHTLSQLHSRVPGVKRRAEAGRGGDGQERGPSHTPDHNIRM